MQSPEYVKMSHATAISLGLAKGRMYRGAVNRCVNLLVHYPEGCSANCAYCGLAKKRPGTYKEKSFIHVDWPIYHMDEIIDAINSAPKYVQRTCISMITNPKCTQATIDMSQALNDMTSLPISVLIAPTIIDKDFLENLSNVGVDKIGIAMDLANQELFNRYRGSGVSGPHKWERYWDTLREGLDIFGQYNVGAHLMVGMGETEKEMVRLMNRLWQMGVVNHLFSFFPEESSRLADKEPPSWSTYLRIQLARYLIEEGLSTLEKMSFNGNERVIDFGLEPKVNNPFISIETHFFKSA
jgi:biotin synthase